MKKNILFYLIFLSLALLQEHFIVGINQTGESTLFIFEDDITTLAAGDEIGIFADDFLVGSGVWNNEQLEIVAIMEVDLTEFGGPYLPGANSNDQVIIKAWSSFSDFEYIPSYDVIAGSNSFNNLFTVMSNFQCSTNEDNCGICYGPGDIFECGCFDIEDGYCDCDNNIDDCLGNCDGNAIVDECGVCEGDNSSCSDCLGIPYGDAVYDECEICDGDNSTCSDCLGIPNGDAVYDECNICDGDNSSCSDCMGTPNGDAFIDNCGICNGDNSTCDNPDVVLSFYDMGGVVLTNILYSNLISQVCIENVIISDSSGNTLDSAIGDCISFTESFGEFPIYMKNIEPVAGFQFNITGLTITGVSGGAAADAGFTVSSGSNIVLGFSFSGSTLDPSGEFPGCTDINACNYFQNATIDDGSCEYPDEGYDCDGNCLDEDCLGECGGSAVVDECGICEGPGAIYECGCYNIPDNECDCDGNILDCEGVCGGETQFDCLGECGGNAIVDECGECEGPGATFECEDGTLVCNESDCVVECDDDEFDCGDGSCIDGSWECDGVIDCADGSDESDCSSENCYDTDCGFYLLLGLSCEYAMEYGADCTICNEQGYCDGDDGGGGGGGADDGCPDGEIEDCFGSCGPASWLGDGFCDESMIDFNCSDLAYDNGDCPIDFEQHIMPIINANCTSYCHTGSAIYQNGLNLETYSSLMAGGNSGPPVIPYYPGESLIIQKLIGTAPGEQMPDGLPPLSNNYIATISHWITQGAIGPDDDGWEGGCVNDGEIEDCDGNCVDENLLGDGNCDDGEEGEANFNCAQLYFDYSIGSEMPDCPVGNLDFGEFTYNNIDGSATLEILMNCEFPVSNFEIEITGASIIGAFGGSSEDEDFDINFTSSAIIGSGNSTNIPENSGLLTILNINNITDSSICFSSSNITTNIGMQYEAVLGECLDIEALGINLLPEEFAIEKNYPNPFNPITTIKYTIPSADYISLIIYNLKGERVKTIIDSFHSPGFYEIVWNASNVSSGIYILQMKNSKEITSRKITLTK